MSQIDGLLSRNAAWADRMTQGDPNFFRALANRQAPNYLWIGCADSRVPANQIVDLLPGDIFVHRNIANLVVHTDLNCLSVIHYAVAVLHVDHIIVCGHYGCGGIQAAMGNEDFGLVDNWLRHIRDNYRRHREVLETIADSSERHRRMCELNVIEQVGNVCQTSVVRDAWRSGARLSVHGWIYGLEDGIIRDLDVSVSA